MNQEHFNLVRSDLSDMGNAPSGNKRLRERLAECRITTDTELPPLEYLFQLFDVPCFYKGELTAVCGKAKSGKTLFLSMLMATAFKPANPKVPNLRLQSEQPLKVLWIDTEQSAQSTQEILTQRIGRILGHTDDTDNTDLEIPANRGTAIVQGACIGHTDSTDTIDDRFFVFNLRGLGYEVRRQLVEAAINELKPDLAIVDGIKDLMTDINDAVQATMLMEQLMALAQRNNCCIVCVLHQNKSEADHNMRGSIGTELTNKAFEVFQCEYVEDADLFKVKQTLSRRQRIRRKLYYRLDGDGLPVECAGKQEQARDARGRWVSSEPKVDDLRKLFTDAMEGRTQRPYNEVMAVALKKCGVADAHNYYAVFREAEEQGIIRQGQHPETKVNWVELCENELPF